MDDTLHSALGIAGVLALAWIAGERRGRVPWRTVASGFVLLLALAVALLKVPALNALFALANEALIALQRATESGTSFVFGYLGGGALPFAESGAASSFVLAFRALPIVLVVSALSAVLFHWGVLPLAVRGFSWLLERSMRVGGVVGLSTAANVFVGMVEAPVLVRPYLERVTRAEMFMIMVGGMASIAGTVLALYAQFLATAVPDALAHLLVASILSAPAAIMISVIMVPPEGEATGGAAALVRESSSTMDAVTRGTLAGAELLVNIVAMLIVLIALVSIVNLGLGLLPHVDGGALSLQRLLGWLLAPLAWLCGVPWQEAGAAGALLGTKTVLNEFLAYLDLAALPPGELSPRSRLIMAYALCGFANFGSLGIMIGGLATMAPGRRTEIVGLGLKSIVGGTLSTCLIAAAVSLLV